MIDELFLDELKIKWRNNYMSLLKLNIDNRCVRSKYEKYQIYFI